MMFLFLFLSCVQSELSKESERFHNELGKLHKQYLEAVLLYEQRQYDRSVSIFRSLHTQYPMSRAILEGVLLSEFESSTEFTVGYDRVKRYLAKKPGDADFRLLQVKYHLKSKNPVLANEDIELLLFNQSIHPWKLAQDPILTEYQSDIDNKQLPFDLITVVQFEAPKVVIMGDPFEMRLSVLHLNDCAVSVPAVSIDLHLEPTHLRLYEESVDDIVQKTTLVQGFQSLSATQSSSASMEVQCGNAKVNVVLPAIESVALKEVQGAVTTSSVEFPNVRLLPKQDSGIPWSLYVNNIEVQAGFWTHN